MEEKRRLTMHRSEPTEIKERLEEAIEHIHPEHEHSEHPHHEQADSRNKLMALTTAIIAVFTAIVASFAGNYASDAYLQKNNAILYQDKATDQWAYYQAKGIKLSLAQNFYNETHNQQLKQDVDRYTNEQEAIRKDAEHFEFLAQQANDQSARTLAKNEKMDFATLLCQVAIALSAMSALLKQKMLWIGSLSLAAIALGIFMVGLF
jgi:hypothetical protein